MDTTLVVGPGWLGSVIASAMRDRGDRVWTLRRGAISSAENLGARLPDERAPHELFGDVAGPTAALERTLRDGPTTVDHVVLSVAPSRARGDTHATLYPAAARGAVRLAEMLGARTLTYTSSTGVYGVTDGSIVDETSQLHTNDERSRALVEAENAILHDTCERATLRLVLRVAGLYGPGRDPAARFAHESPGDAHGDRWCNFSWRDDVCAAVLHLQSALQASSGAEIFNVADGQPVQAREISAWLRDARNDGSESDTGSTTRPPRDAGTSARSNQRVSVDKLRSTGWTPAVGNVFEGLRRLMSRNAR